MTVKDIVDALSEDAINKNKCSKDVDKNAVECSSVLKDSSSLLRLSDYWIQLDTAPSSRGKITSLLKDTISGINLMLIFFYIKRFLA